MRFFKYLFLILLSFYSISSYSAESYYLETQPTFRSGSMQSTCGQLATHLHETLGGGSVMYSLESASATTHLKFDFACVVRRYVYDNYSTQNWYGYKEDPIIKCHTQDYPMVFRYGYNDPTPNRVCNKNPDGSFCIFENMSNDNIFREKSYRTKNLFSVSEIPSPSCVPSSTPDTCNPQDPYGGCFVPSNDGCYRSSNGSINCPPDAPPPVPEPGCKNGAIYCDRPPQGCGSTHVSGKLNGKLVCVAKGANTSDSADHSSSPNTSSSSNNDGSNTSVSKNSNGDVTGTSTVGSDGTKTNTTVSNPTSNGTSSSTTTTTSSNGSTSTSSSTTTVTNNNNTTTVTTVNNNTTTTIVTNNTTGQTTTTVSKDGEETTTDGKTQTSKDNDQSTSSILSSLSDFKNELLTSLSEIKDALTGKGDGAGGDGDGGGDGAGGDGDGGGGGDGAGGDGDGDGGGCADTEVNTVFCKLSDWLQEDVPEDESVEVPVSELTEQSFSTGIFSSNAQCPIDRTLNMSVGSRSFSKTISLSPWCDSLAFFGYIILISAYCYSAHIVVSKS